MIFGGFFYSKMLRKMKTLFCLMKHFLFGWVRICLSVDKDVNKKSY